MSDAPIPAPYTAQELWVATHMIQSIRAECRMTGVDTADYYVHLTATDGEKACWLQSTFDKVADLDLGGHYVAKAKRGIAEKVKARKDWETQNKRELSEYKRLKEKFEGVGA